MANIKSQMKRIKTNAIRTERNKAYKSELRTWIRKTREAGAAALDVMPPHHWLRFGFTSGHALQYFEAIHQAALLRFRPILMTTLAALFAAVPLMLGWGEGSELRRPLGIASVDVAAGIAPQHLEQQRDLRRIQPAVTTQVLAEAAALALA